MEHKDTKPQRNNPRRKDTKFPCEQPLCLYSRRSPLWLRVFVFHYNFYDYPQVCHQWSPKDWKTTGGGAIRLRLSGAKNPRKEHLPTSKAPNQRSTKSRGGRICCRPFRAYGERKCPYRGFTPPSVVCRAFGAYMADSPSVFCCPLTSSTFGSGLWWYTCG